MSKVAVILVSYNHGNYLCESIERVLNQTFSDFELIVGDDASADGYWSIIQSYSVPVFMCSEMKLKKWGNHSVMQREKSRKVM